jgi:putative Mg2+ transporter-C (MgtC) family protein
MLENEFLGSLVLPLPILVLRLLGAAALCALIGYERETSRRSAGLRTNMIVGVASATYALISLHLVDLYTDRGEAVRMDPLRLVEATTAGVAFLAAGMIVLTRGKVKNLTTGALLWLSAAIGVAAGNGLWPIAVLAALLGLGIVSLRGGQPEAEKPGEKPEEEKD